MQQWNAIIFESIAFATQQVLLNNQVLKLYYGRFLNRGNSLIWIVTIYYFVKFLWNSTVNLETKFESACVGLKWLSLKKVVRAKIAPAITSPQEKSYTNIQSYYLYWGKKF